MAKKKKKKTIKKCKMCEGVVVKGKKRFCPTCLKKRQQISSWKNRGLVPSFDDPDDWDWEWVFELKEITSCQICGRTPKKAKRSLHIDHDHSTGLIRGVICYRCNRFLLWGCRDSRDILCSAISYLTPAGESGITACSENVNETGKKGDI